VGWEKKVLKVFPLRNEEEEKKGRGKEKLFGKDRYKKGVEEKRGGTRKGEKPNHQKNIQRKNLHPWMRKKGVVVGDEKRSGIRETAEKMRKISSVSPCFGGQRKREGDFDLGRKGVI